MRIQITGWENALLHGDRIFAVSEVISVNPERAASIETYIGIREYFVS